VSDLSVASVKLLFEPDEAGPDWATLNSTLINQMAGTGDSAWGPRAGCAHQNITIFAH
jgi:hypothetical protein